MKRRTLSIKKIIPPGPGVPSIVTKVDKSLRSEWSTVIRTQIAQMYYTLVDTSKLHNVYLKGVMIFKTVILTIKLKSLLTAVHTFGSSRY